MLRCLAGNFEALVVQAVLGRICGLPKIRNHVLERLIIIITVVYSVLDLQCTGLSLSRSVQGTDSDASNRNAVTPPPNLNPKPKTPNLRAKLRAG